MSESKQVPVSTTPTNFSDVFTDSGLSDVVAGTCAVAAGVIAITAKAAGAVCWEIGAGTVKGCKEVYRLCKEGKYPVENLQMAYTPISNFDGLTHMLEGQGFKLNPGVTTPDLGLSVAFNPLTSERLFVVNSSDGIGLISESKDLIQSSIQGFATQEISLVLEEMGLKVAVEEKGKSNVITANDKEKNNIEIKIDKETAVVHVDTRKSRRPKCDLIHQLISQKLKEPNRNRNSGHQIKKRQDVIQIKK